MNTIKELIRAEMKRDSSAGVDYDVLKTSLHSANIQTSQTEIDNCVREIQREHAEQERQEELAKFLVNYETALRNDYPNLETEFGLDGESGKARMVLWLEGKPQRHSAMIDISIRDGKAAVV